MVSRTTDFKTVLDILSDLRVSHWLKQSMWLWRLLAVWCCPCQIVGLVVL